MALITVEYWEQQMATLGLKSSFAPDSAYQLPTLIDEASEWVQDYCQRRFGEQTITEVVRGRNARRLLLQEWPIATVDSLTYVADAGGDGEVDGEDYTILPAGMLEYKWSEKWLKTNTYTVEYTLESDIPKPVQRATALKVTDLLRPMYTGPRDRAPELVSVVEEQIIDLLEKHRRERLG